jgi:hypothetical protein
LGINVGVAGKKFLEPQVRLAEIFPRVPKVILDPALIFDLLEPGVVKVEKRTEGGQDEKHDHRGNKVEALFTKHDRSPDG